MANPYFKVKCIISYSYTKYEKWLICGFSLHRQIGNYRNTK